MRLILSDKKDKKRQQGGVRLADHASKARPSDAMFPGVRIVIPTRGNALRTVITGTKIIGSTCYASRKNRCGLPTEATTEFLGAKRDEVRVETRRIRVQPFRVELMTSTGIHRHIPDKARQIADGSWEIEDAKREWKDFRTPEGELQTMLGQAAADALGAKYVRVTLENMGTQTFQDNVELIQIYRFVPVSVRHQLLATEFLANNPRVPLGTLADHLHPSPENGFALVCAMMVQRLVEIDLSIRLNRHSAVIAVPQTPFASSDLFASLRTFVPLAA